MKLPIEIQGENNEMCEEMEDVCDGAFEFEDSVEIDLDFEFDVAKFFDFTRSETPEEIEVSEAWFECAKGHPPSRKSSYPIPPPPKNHIILYSVIFYIYI